MVDTILNINLIASNPEVRGGRPVVAGTGICVSDIAAMTIFQRLAPDTIAAEYGLTLAQVYAALAYYYGHKAEVDRELRERDELIAAAKEQRRIKDGDGVTR